MLDDTLCAVRCALCAVRCALCAVRCMRALCAVEASIMLRNAVEWGGYMLGAKVGPPKILVFGFFGIAYIGAWSPRGTNLRPLLAVGGSKDEDPRLETQRLLCV